MSATLWPLRLASARLRPLNAQMIAKLIVVSLLFTGFLYLEYRFFLRLFSAVAEIEALNPFFALGLVENLIGLVFLVAIYVLFFSALTSAIGAYFTDLDLDIYHSAPVSKVRLVLARWGKTFIQSSYLVISFLLPLFAAFGAQYDLGGFFFLEATLALALLLSAPVSLACVAVIVLVRYFPVRRVHQIAATLAIIALSLAAIALRMSRPERLFQNIQTDDLRQVLQTIEMPSADLFPSTWLAQRVVAAATGESAWPPLIRLALLAAISLTLLLTAGTAMYFRAWVRSRETSAPVALGSSGLTRLLDYLTARFDPQTRAIIGKEVRLLTREAAQWSQLFMMLALLFLYLYNIKMLPLQGDIRAVFVAYLNLGMSGFIVAAICLRFAFPSISAEGKQFWILETAPISYRQLLWIKVVVYLVPLLFVSLLLTVLGNWILDAPGLIWIYTVGGSTLIATTLVALGVGMGATAPNFKIENPLEVATSLGGFLYMGASLLYVGIIMILTARPMHRFMLRVWFGTSQEATAMVLVIPIAAAVALSLLLSVVPMEIAVRRLRLRQIA